MQISDSLRIALVVNNLPENGGANTYESCFIETLKSTSSENIYFEVFYSDFKVRFLDIFKSKNKSFKKIRVTFILKFRLLLEMSLLLSSLISRFSIFELKFEKNLKNNFSAVIFLSPNPLAILVKTIPLITSVWDLGHRDLPFLPEFQLKNNFKEREFYYQQTIPKSTLILVDSETTKNSLVKLYGATPDRVLVSGLFPQNPNLQLMETDNKFDFDYIFYPALFWPHKNHVRLVLAFAEVSKKYPELKLMLSGSDKGELRKIKKLIKELDLNNRIEYLGFLTREQYWNTLKNCELLVFPTLLGPTNIPPLEAGMIGKKMVVSEFHKSFLDNFKLKATYFDPYSAESIADAIISGLEDTDENPKIDFTYSNQIVMTNILNKICNLLMIENPRKFRG